MAGVNRTTGKATDLITFSRASGGTALRKISYGSELVTNGTFDTDTDWTKTGATTISGGKANLDGTSSTGLLYQDVLTQGRVYQASFDIDSISGTMTVINNDGTTLGTYTTSGSKSLVFVNSIASGNFIFRVATGSNTATVDNISVKEVLFDQPDGTLTLFNHPNNTPRIEYAADGTVKGLLIEESRTNLIAPSNDFDAAFISQTGVNVSSAYGTSPDGTVNADKLVADTSTGFHRIVKTGVPTSSGVDYSYSCFFKAAGETVAGLGLFDGTNWLGRASVDLTTGVASVSNGSAKVDDFGNGWYRLTVYGTSLGTSHAAYIYVKSLFSSTGNGTDGVLAYGAQIEAGSFPTSYIPTSGATATRAADIASIPVSAFGYNQKAGSVVIEAQTLSTAVNNHQDFRLGDTNNGFNSGSRVGGGVAGQYTMWVRSGGVTLVFMSKSGVVSDGVGYKSAIAGSLNDFALTVNGEAVVTDVTGDMPLAATQALIGNGYGYLNGHIKSIAYYPRRLSNAQLQELTA